MELEVRHLRIVVSIADHRSITKAAVALGMSQPSLTAQLQRIETEMGSKLFDRSRHGVVPTTVGRSVLDRARVMIAEMDRFTSGASAPRPALRIGAAPGVLLPTAVPGIVSLCGLEEPNGRPAIAVSVHPETSAGLMGLVQAGHLHAALLMEVDDFPVATPPELRRETVIAREPSYVALAEGHPLAAKEELDLADLAGERWLVDAADERLDLLPLRAACHTAGFEPEIKYQITDINAARVFIANGECVSLAQAISREDRGIVLRPLAGEPIVMRVDLVWSPRCPADPAHLLTAIRHAYDTVVASANPAYRARFDKSGEV